MCVGIHAVPPGRRQPEAAGRGEKTDAMCGCLFLQSLQAGGSLKQLVTLVGGGDS